MHLGTPSNAPSMARQNQKRPNPDRRWDTRHPCPSCRRANRTDVILRELRNTPNSRLLPLYCREVAHKPHKFDQRESYARTCYEICGTSVATLDRIKRVAKRVALEVAKGYDVIVIVSAMSGKTNDLVGWVNETSPFMMLVNMMLWCPLVKM